MEAGGVGQPPQPSRWNPGDDPNELCKIELSQQADLGIRALVSHPDLGLWAARVTGARMVQVWWTQLLYKPPSRRRASWAPSPTRNG